MATGQTPTYLLPYPLSTDPVDVHGDIFELADRLEDVIGGLSSLPAQSGNSGKFLTTNGSAASWATIPIPAAATPNVIGTVFGRTSSEVVSGVPSYVNVGLGYKALEARVGSSNSFYGNVAFGVEAMKSLTSGTGNVAIGHMAGRSVESGSDNIFIGNFAGDSMSGDYNIGIGTDTFNSALAANSPYYANIAVGDNAMNSFLQGDGNTIIGDSAATGLEIGYNNIVIGADAEPSSFEVSNEITLGNNDIGRFRIPGLSTIIGPDTGFFTPVMMEHIWEDTDEFTGAVDFSLSNGNSRYYSNCTGNWQINLVWDSVTPFHDSANIDQLDAQYASATIVVMAEQGATPYYATAFKIDGVTQTVKWQGGTAPSAGNANSIDIYTYTVIPLNIELDIYLVLGSMTKFA